MLWILSLGLILASKLEECLFDERNIEKALKMEIEQPIDYALKYFVLKRFAKKPEEAAALLLNTPEDNVYVNLIIARLPKSDTTLEITTKVQNHFLDGLGKDIAEGFFKNRFDFKEMTLLEDKKRIHDIKEVLKNIWSRDQIIVMKFFYYIETRDIRIETVAKELEFLARNKEPQAHYLLGHMYLIGCGVERDLDKALTHFLSSSPLDNGTHHVGIAKVYMEEDNKNIKEAIKHLKSAQEQGSSPEGLYCLHLLTEPSTPESIDDVPLLKKAAFSGYLPAVYRFGQCLIREGTEDSANHSLMSVTAYHPELLKYDRLAYGCYRERQYAKALMIYLFLSEFNISTAVKNCLYLMENHKVLDGQDSIMCTMCKNLAKTDMKFNKNVGDCYFYGIGVEKSYSSAFSSYLSSKKVSEEGAYNAAVMYEYGLGVKKNLLEAIRIIHKYLRSEETYLVRWYSLARLGVKLFFDDSLTLYAMAVSFVLAFATFLLFDIFK